MHLPLNRVYILSSVWYEFDATGMLHNKSPIKYVNAL